jgi:SRSO17 transposase
VATVPIVLNRRSGGQLPGRSGLHQITRILAPVYSQCLVSLTLAREDVFVPIGLRLYLPQSWTNDPARCERAKVPTTIGYRPKWRIALDEIDRMRAAGVRFGSALADAGYGMCAEFRRGLSERELLWAVGILSTQNMYVEDVKVTMPRNRLGRPRIHPKVGALPCPAERFIESHGTFRRVVWRKGTKGPLNGDFAIVRVRPADGDEAQDRVHLPGDPAWLVCERLSNGDRKYSWRIFRHPRHARRSSPQSKLDGHANKDTSR